MKKLHLRIKHCLAVLRMGSEDLAAMTLPPWLLTTLDVRNEVRKDYISLVAAGVAFYFLLAAFPAIGAAVSIAGLFLDPYLVRDQLSILSNFLPPEALGILLDQAESLAASGNRTLSVSLILSALFTLYSAARGVNALIKGLNIAYNVKERRGMLWQTAVAYGFTFLFIAYFLLSLLLVAGLPAAIQLIPLLPEFVREQALWLRWPMLFGMALLGLEFLYTLGPSRKGVTLWPLPFLSAGSFAATLLWLAGSSLFSLFITHFARFNETYGSLGAVVVLMLWFWLSAMAILIGAEINGTLEKHRARNEDCA